MPATKVTTSPASRRALVVVGMHRSGTSAMARLLSLSGADLPPDLVGAGQDNPLGFWEPARMVALSDEMMASVGSRWDDIFNFEAAGRLAAEPFMARAEAFVGAASGALPVFKDPRASVLAGVWTRALVRQDINPLFIVTVRHPLEVAASLHARSGMPRAQALMLWLSHMVAVERDTRDQPRLFVTYGDMLSDWRDVLDRVQAALGAPLPNRTPEAEGRIDAFLSADQRHHVVDAGDLGQALAWPGLEEAYRWMLAAASDRAPAPDVMTRIEEDLRGLARLVGPALAEAHREAALYPLTRFRLGEAEQEIEALRTLCNRFHAEGDLAQQAAAAAERHAARVMHERDVALAEIARHEIGLIVERSRTEDAIAHDGARIRNLSTERDDLKRRSDAAERQAHLLQVAIEDADRRTLGLQAALDYAESQTASLSEVLDGTRAERDLASAKLETLGETFSRLQREHDEGRAERDALRARLAVVEVDRAAMRDSRSWRLTRPLRRLGGNKPSERE